MDDVTSYYAQPAPALNSGGLVARQAPFVKNALKALRGSQPFNWAATTGMRKVSRLVGGAPELVIKYLHRVGSVTCRLPNGRTLRLCSRGDDWVSNQIFWRGWDGYERETVPLFFRLAQRSAVTLDVGAYVGFFTMLASLANPSGQVLALEPMGTIAARLRRHVALNRLTNVECIQAAAGDAEGEAEFFHHEAELPTSSSLSRQFMEGGGATFVTSRVPVVRLDRLVSERKLGPVGLVKIDTESTEHQVLRGFSETLTRDRPLVICEVLLGRSPGPEIESILGPLGYRYYLLTPRGPELRTTIEGHAEWLNYLFTPLPPDEVDLL